MANVQANMGTLVICVGKNPQVMLSLVCANAHMMSLSLILYMSSTCVTW